jgi:hypothetical protein
LNDLTWKPTNKGCTLRNQLAAFGRSNGRYSEHFQFVVTEMFKADTS